MTTVMTYTSEETRPGTRQTVRHIYRAELVRLFSAGGIRASTIVMGSLALAGGGLALLIMMLIFDETSSLHMTVPLELSTTISALGMCLMTVIAACRDNTGMVNFSLLYTPRRRRLVCARLAAFASVAGLVTAGVLVIMTIVVGVVAHVFPADLVAAGILLGTCASVLLVSACAGLATLVERLAPALLIFVGIFFVLPLAIGVFGAMAPDWAQSAAEVTISAMPTSLLLPAISLPTLHTVGVDPNIWAQLGLAAWTAAACGGAVWVFLRRDR